jgi:Fur family ferric uptake transcriptional regulator
VEIAHTTSQDELRRAGLRATSARVAILTELRRHAGPLSHGEMEERLRGRPWNRTTIYRSLVDLTRVGLARRFDVGDHVWRFEATGRRQEEHPHFVCNACGDIACLDGVALEVARPEGAPRAIVAREVEIQVHGVCDRCQ